MRDLFINHVSGFLIWLVKFLPFSLLKYLINILAILLAIMLKRFRVIAKKNYTFVYDRKPEIYKGFTITYGIYKLLGMQAVDVLTFIDGKYPRNNFIDNVYGLSYLNEAINKCNGIIIISAHIGNFTLLNLLLKELGYTDCAMIMRSVKNKKIEEKLNNIKQKAQINFFNESYIKKNILMLATFLRKKGILILITDQRHLKGVPLEFFGKTKMSPPGPPLYLY
jgi:lauroyl/myristoyl acyltransferase